MGNQSHRFAAAPSLATAFAALVPGFVHVMGTVYNDGLSFLTVAIACNVATRLVLDGFTWRRVAALSVALSVAVLTRFSGLFVVACGLAAFVCSGWLGEDRQTKSRWWRTLGAALLVLAAVIATSCW